MRPCAGLPNATGVTPWVAANIRPGEIANAVPVAVLKSMLPAYAAVGSEVLDEQAVSAIDNPTVATHRLAINAIRMI
ncbi:hypothetical protein NJB18091_49460 [Mycobacterium marinum]|nr:hypothetical protein BB170200_02951 [Mycobacterium marinum]BBA89900.1 hypothetical protein MPSD_45660 [Mycobacterium pseudoshottsii JCM 15466]GJO07816.1 hypothetical protein NJB18091_49460 [Mycobacterium marinum]GJO33852.1 hypothetical protein NJB1507_45950 [Mycobacterium marinum]GJO81690.1 hypothetical protein NJB1728910S_07000 [Mycobacterium marinum]